MGVARVGLSKDDLYSASVEYDSETPFGQVIGPTDVSVGEAVSWARRHAQVVILRTDEAFYSAGDVAAEDLPVWPAVERVLWEVEGHVGSRGGHLAEVGLRLSEAIQRDPRTSDARHWLQDWGLAVAFTIRCPRTEAYELGSRVLRESWQAAGIPADRVGELSTSSVTVRELPERRPPKSRRTP